METRDPIQRLREELSRKPLFSERNGYKPLDREPLLELLDEIETRYMRLPVDADGVPIRMGDVLDFRGFKAKCAAVSQEHIYYWNANGFWDWVNADECCHVKTETVDSIVAEIYHLVHETEDERGLIAKYAERIRKAIENE